MSDRVDFTVRGATYDEICVNAYTIAASFFGERDFDFLDFTARPELLRISGSVDLWAAEVSAVAL